MPARLEQGTGQQRTEPEVAAPELAGLAEFVRGLGERCSWKAITAARKAVACNGSSSFHALRFSAVNADQQATASA